jgi:RHH-type transcriptional regulator, proline utilization regulon repressor / proline dehydrogenase / delta 1-pyrroline-5-carboxylate dehydrogenase
MNTDPPSRHNLFKPDHITRLDALYLRGEQPLTAALAASVPLDAAQREQVGAVAGKWVETVRHETARSGMIDAFLQEYGLSTKEGVILMRLSEALIRTPDFATAQELMRDKLGSGAWDAHAGASSATVINAATAGLRLSAAWISATGGSAAARLAAKLGDRVLHAAVSQGMGLMARHFVLGRSIADATARAREEQADGGLYSFDMLGEGACTQADAEHYFAAYENAVRHLAAAASGNGATNPVSAATANGLSVKLSALHPRYEYAQREDCVPALVARVRALAVIAKDAGIGLTIDAEETHRLELSLHIFAALLSDAELAGWDGLGIVVQAYQRRASGVIDAVIDMAKAAGRTVAVRLVKGAYWDTEIKRAQELGLESYPVFTRKEHTDISYLACAAQLLNAGPCVFPQFATHNAHSAAAILAMAGDGRHFEFQRLHGMGETLHGAICRDTGVRSRVYAPVGGHKELLPYLVRRLLENGANSSFVNQLMNPEIEVDEIVADPIAAAQAHEFAPNAAIGAPRDLFGGERLSAKGMDLTQSSAAKRAEVAVAAGEQRTSVAPDGAEASLDAVIASAQHSGWATTFPEVRAACLTKAADLMEQRMPALMALCVEEAGKTLPDALSEIREAVDFCHYYAGQALAERMVGRAPLGIVACVSPWNFPLAIFIGQVGAALVAGNCVIAKPAAQTPRIAHAAVEILYEAGVPQGALHLMTGGPEVGAAIVGHASVDAVCFTGSTATAKRIAAARAGAGRADTVLIAETGGINAMIIDSTALLEQAVADVVASAFQSAGQRCSACRLVCVQDDIAEDFERMLAGAIAVLRVGNPALLTTDVGPIIDAEAHAKIAAYVDQVRTQFRVIGEAPVALDTAAGHFIRPIAIAVNAISDVQQEIFGPVLHVVRFAADAFQDVVTRINALGYGLTLGLHTRIDARVNAVAAAARVGNIYVNRNQIGAVVGVQPFGGEGLSGTGPKAGGPHYLPRLSKLGFAQCPHADLAEEIKNLVRKLNLPGPTGEENSLELVSRGVMLCLGGDDPDDLQHQIAAVQAAGCDAVIDDDLTDVLKHDFDAVVLEGSRRESVAARLTQRDGPLIPLLSLSSDPERYFLERTLTVNTSAAGGNASLIAM